MSRASLLENCKFHVLAKPFTCEEIRKDFLVSLGFLQQKVTHTREKSNSGTECVVAFHSVKYHYNREDILKTFSPPNTFIRTSKSS